MAITYSWKVNSLKVQNTSNANNYVVQTYWTKTGTDENGNQGKFNGATPFSSSNFNANTYIDFQHLQEEDVISWIQNVVVDHYEQHVNDKIQKEIDLIVDPIREEPNPWANNDTTTTQTTV